MVTPLSPDLHEIAASVSSELDGRLTPDSLRWLRDPEDHLVPDAVLALYLDARNARENAVLLVSNPQFPDAVRDAVAHARTVAEKLHPDTASHVHLPITSGRHGAQSYALFPRLEPVSDNKLLRLAQKNLSAPRVARWLQDVAAQTRQNVQTEARKEVLFKAPLAYLAQEPDLPAPINAFAQRWQTQIAHTETPLFTVVTHGDFWIGNVLFDPSPLPGLLGGFRVIDWGGASLEGYPGIDLLRYCKSCFRSTARQPRDLMTAYMDSLDIPHDMRGLYPMAAIGHLGLNLDQFPKKRFIALACDVFETLTSIGMLPDVPGPGAT